MHQSGIWISVLSNLERDIFDRLVSCRVKRVYLKVPDCSLNTIRTFQERGIAVWAWSPIGPNADTDDAVYALRQALACGIEGYVADLSPTFEDPASHPVLEKALTKIRALVPQGKLGVTCLQGAGLPPLFPWPVIDAQTDLLLPKTDAHSVIDVLRCHQELGLKAHVLPLWDAKKAASVAVLNATLRQFPGSSVWRVPAPGEQGDALRLDYSQSTNANGGAAAGDFKLPQLVRVLSRGASGIEVKSLQRVLTSLGYDPGQYDGEFGPLTESAVRAFQTKAELTPDGIVGPLTWQELGGKSDPKIGERTPGGDLALALADFAEKEAEKSASWLGPKSDAEKYLKLYREALQKLGHIGETPIFYDWCAAFVGYCAKHVGLKIPDIPHGLHTSMAKVSSWKHWARQQNYWYDAKAVSPRRGDILIHDFDGNGILDHISICRGYHAGSLTVQTSEGNRSNRSGNFERRLSTIAGIIRIT